MSSRRTQKAAEAIREVVSMAILTELKDPRVRDVTVTHVEVTPDMRQAKVHVSIMGDEKKQKLTLHGLENSAGFLQSKVAKRIDTRYTPRLAFVLDLGVKRSIEIAQILQQVLPKQSTPADEIADIEEADAEEADMDQSAAKGVEPAGPVSGDPPEATAPG
jgi:ribosome-binding factor A